MFYVFYVNNGFMMVLEIPVLANVAELNRSIYEAIDVPIDEQFLLLESGESLDNNRTLSSYNAGTQHKPVYFIRANYINSNRGLQQLKEKEEKEGRLPIDECRRHLQHLDTLHDTAEVVKGYFDFAKNTVGSCEKSLVYCAQLIRDHKLMNNGWIALMSNLDDSIAKLEKRLERTGNYNDRMKTMCEKGAPMIQNFDNIIATLEKIIIPPQLLSDGEGGDEESLSLYGWLSSKDREYSVEAIAEHAQKQMNLASEAKEFHTAANNLKIVREQSKKTEYRDIKGINKRLVQLEHQLSAMEELVKKVKQYAEGVLQPAPTELNQSIAFANQQKELANKILENMVEFNKTMGSFIMSKEEVLKNILTRLSGWVKSIYERLSSANSEMMIMENIYDGLKQRLDVVRQVRDAPAMYAIAIAEVIRRNTFRKEFEQWLNQFIEKCRQFLKEENNQRSEFFSKLDRHFIRQLFPGMGDMVPNVCPDRTKFDDSLPQLDAEHIRNLRKMVPELEFFLKADVPQVFSKLMVCDPTFIQSISSPGIRREESFFVRDGSANVGTLTKNFPSSTWLSGDDNIEMSPVLNRGAILMAKGVKASGSSASIHDPPRPLTSSLAIAEIKEGEREFVSSSARSAPINIPMNLNRNACISDADKSSYFSTPDDHFGSLGDDFHKVHHFNQDVDVNVNAAHIIKVLRQMNPLRAALHRIAGETTSIKSSITEIQQAFFAEFADLQTSIVAHCAAVIKTLQEQHDEQMETERTKAAVSLDDLKNVVSEKDRIIDEMKEKLELLEKAETQAESEMNELGKNLAEKSALFDKLQNDFSEFSAKKSELETLIEERDSKIKDLETQLRESKEEVEKLNEEQKSWIDEKEKKNIDPFFVGFDFISNLLKRDLTEDELNALRAEHDRRSAESAATICDCLGSSIDGEESFEEATLKESAIRTDVEMEYKNRMQLLVRGMEKRNAKEICRVRDEIQSAHEQEISGYKERILEMESRLGNMEFSKSIQAISSSEPSSSGLLTALPTGSQIQESCMLISKDCSQNAAEVSEEIKDAMLEDLDEDDGIAAVNVNTMATQTRLCLKEMRMMISLLDIHEGCAVLVMWDDVHNSYTVFCSSPTLHFVKESSMKRMGVIGVQKPATRRNLILATITHIEFCQIKKIDNRYKLPMDTRFYRVDIEALPLDSSTYRRRRND